MPSIAESTGDTQSRERWRLVVGVCSFLVGALLVGLGTAGSVGGVSAKTELIVGGAAVILCLAVFGVRADLRDHERDLVAIGVVIGLASLLFVWGLTPNTVGATPVLTAAGGFGYLAGMIVVLAAILAGSTMDWGTTPRRSGPDRVEWTRSAENGGRPNHAADGGEQDDELSFPLDDE